MITLFSVMLCRKAEKQLKGIGSEMRGRVEGLFEALERNPVPAREYDVKKIKGETDAYRIRLSSFRIMYAVFWNEKIVRIAKIELRSETTYD